MPKDRSQSKKARALFTAVLLLVAVAGMEITSYAGIAVANTFLTRRIYRTPTIFAEQSQLIRTMFDLELAFDPRVGFRYKPGTYDHYSSGTLVINGERLRSSRDYTPAPAPGILRIAAFGDSFVYGAEASNDDVWTARIEAEHTNVEVLNYGVGAFGMAQAYLRFLDEGKSREPDVILIGFSPVMMRRTVSVYRRFSADGNPVVKPRFILTEGGELHMLPSPIADVSGYERYLADPATVTELGTNDHWYSPAIYENPLYDLSATVRLLTAIAIRLDNRYFNPDRMLRGGVFNESSEAFRIQSALLEKFASEAGQVAQTVFVVVFPAALDVYNAAEGKSTLYQPLLGELDRRGVPYLDLLDAFEGAETAEEIEALFMPNRHYSARGNQAVADFVMAKLAEGAHRDP